MATTPPISVVVPMRNASRWLAPLLAALVREWNIGFELVVVNDGSSDGSAELLQRLCNHWPRDRWQLLDGGGRGVSAARNHGVASSQAPLIAFLDADDRPLSGRLKLPLQALTEDSSLSHVHGGWWRCDAAGRLQHAVQPWREGARFDWRGFMEHKAVLPSAWSVRRTALESVGGFDEGLHHSEDVDLLLRLAANGHKGAWIGRELVRYRLHGSNASGRLHSQLRGLLNVTERHLSETPEEHSDWAEEQRFATRIWACWQAWQQSEDSFALELLQQAMRHCSLPLVRRPVHLIEAMQRSSDRIGAHFDRNRLLASGFWQRAEALVLVR